MPAPLTQKLVAAAIAAGKPADVADGRSRGLVLRVRGPDSWTWTIRRYAGGKAHRFDLGPEWTLDEARRLLLQFDLMSERGSYAPWGYGKSEWNLFLTRQRAAKSGATLEEHKEEGLTHRKASRMFKQCIPDFVAEIARTRRETTAEGYKWSLQVAELKPFHNRLVDEITRQDMAGVVKAIADRGAERQAELVTVALRRFFKWLGSDTEIKRTNVQPGVMEPLLAPERTLVEDDGSDDDGDNTSRVPTADDVARIMRWLRDDAARGADGSPVLERDRLAGQLLVYTVQRRRYVAMATKREFESAGALGGLWRMPPIHRKTAAMKQRRNRGLDIGDHVVPLPPAAWKVVKRAMELAGDSPYLFPAVRPRKAGSEKKSMAPASLTHLFEDVTGNDCYPHSMRRAFGTTYARAVRMKLSEIKLILDHSEGVASGDVTKTHYAFLDGTHEKWALMQGWVDWVDAAAARGPI
jgi:integrase